MTDTTDIVPAPEAHAIQLGAVATSGPSELLATATTIAGELARLIEDRGLANKIGTRKYVRVEGWTTLIAMLGVTAREVSVQEQDDGSFVAVVELARVSDGVVIGRGSALCSPAEAKWRGRDAYAIRSMATTRATGKACRLAFSWIVTLAGFDPTPAEEIPDQRDQGGGAAPKATAGVLGVLGHNGARHLIDRLAAYGKTYGDLIEQLKADDQAA